MTQRPSNEVMTKFAAAVIGGFHVGDRGSRAPSRARQNHAGVRANQGGAAAAALPPNPRAGTRHGDRRQPDDIRKLPALLKERLVQLAGRPHSVLPVQAFAEADQPSQLFQYYLLDTSGFDGTCSRRATQASTMRRS